MKAKKSLLPLIVLGAGLGPGWLTAMLNQFPEPKPPREKTAADLATIARAEEKRQRKANKIKRAGK
jgi:hypothetical protein